MTFGYIWPLQRQSDGDGNGLTVLRGVQFVLQSQENVNWIMFSSEPISFVFDTNVRTDIVAVKSFKGTIRLAIIPPNTKIKDSTNGMVQVSSSTGLRRLVYHASVYPTGAKVDFDFRDPSATTTTTNSVAKSVLNGLASATGANVAANRIAAEATMQSTGGRVANVHFRFVTKTANSNSAAAAAASTESTGLLMLSLPHHAFSFTFNHMLDSKHFDLVYQCIKGSMTPVVGSVWTYEEKLPTLGFEPLAGDYAASSSSYSVDAILSNMSIRKILSDSLEKDLMDAMPTRTENIYGFGKSVARLAQLVHISDKLAGPDNPLNVNKTLSNMTTTNSSSSTRSSAGSMYERASNLRQTALEKLSSYLELLLTNQLSDSLLYDASLGGLVSTDGLSDFNADFGNGRYNGTFMAFSPSICLSCVCHHQAYTVARFPASLQITTSTMGTHDLATEQNLISIRHCSLLTIPFLVSSSSDPQIHSVCLRYYGKA